MMRTSFQFRFGRFELNRRRIAAAVLCATVIAAGTVIAVCLMVPLGAQAADQAAAEEPEETLPPEDVSLVTDDGVEIAATYYPSTFGKSAAPIILLHMQGRDRRDWHDFARQLQVEQFAVLTLDLRGHGQSTTVEDDDTPLEAARLTPDDYQTMAEVNLNADYSRSGGDLEMARGFLLERHNAGELNMAKLGIVAAEMSTGVALQWAQNDWEVSQQSHEETTGERIVEVRVFDPTGSKVVIEVSGDQRTIQLPSELSAVKMLVLLSPEWNYRGLNVDGALIDLRENVAMLFIDGQKNRTRREDTTRMYHVVGDWQEKALGMTGPDQLSFLRTHYDTSLVGTAMLGKGLGVEDDIVNFIKLTLNRKDMRLPWVERRGVFTEGE